jgi:hypothetical protein
MHRSDINDPCFLIGREQNPKIPAILAKFAFKKPGQQQALPSQA